MKVYLKGLAHSKIVNYGTAGFRDEDHVLERVAFRVGLFVAKLSA
jgi:hypothetical protein